MLEIPQIKSKYDLYNKYVFAWVVHKSEIKWFISSPKYFLCFPSVSMFLVTLLILLFKSLEFLKFG